MYCGGDNLVIYLRAFHQQIGILDYWQAGKVIFKACTLGWDATDLDGAHINEVHISTVDQDIHHDGELNRTWHYKVWYNCLGEEIQIILSILLILSMIHQ